MNIIRNFIYKNSDIFIVFLILMVAATLIYHRVGIIMDYPAHTAASDPAVTEQMDPSHQTEETDEADETEQAGEPAGTTDEPVGNQE